MSEHLETWSDALRTLGHTPGAVLGSGMEGTVLALEDGLVAKVWQRRARADLERLRTFYDALAGLSLAAPRILDVVDVDGQPCTVEVLLTGTPLRSGPETSAVTPGPAQVEAVVAVLAALAEVEPTPAMALLPVLEGEPPFDPGEQSFERSLADLVSRRVAASRVPLSAALPELDRLHEAVVDRLSSMPTAPPGLVHGDLIPGNILLDGDRPGAVLDFGFLSTVGDPAFDAAVAASIYDMYGPSARATEALLDAAVQDRLGHDPERMAVHRAAYALVTSTCFSPTGDDGHFAWCVALLRRPDVREALGV